MPRRPRALAALVLAALVLAALVLAAAVAGCDATGAAQPAAPAPTSASDSPAAESPSPSPSPTRSVGVTPSASPTPRRTATVAAAAPFTATVSDVTARDLPSSWRTGCPVGPESLRLLRLSFWGFDAAPHTGELVVRDRVAPAVVRVFRRLYEARFPIRRMQRVDVYHGSDDASMRADNTSAFNCRNAVASGPPRWSAHAYGEAIDIDTVENPYIEGGQVRPPDGAAYADRSRARPGMIVAGGVVVRAFAAEGWQWGGRWSTPDYQHFSSTGG